ncbi:MAG TPA: hypothetical protein VFE53_13325 [Mucilaginibacter sp.]|jgi:hypothetical protein|nr:hypothetical protein [Mucilaginibacter sp.]
MLFLIILVLVFAGSFFLPWWAAAIIAVIAALICGGKAGKAFWSGFGAIFVAWTILALMKSIPNDNILASRVVHLFPLPNNWIWVLVVTAVIGGIVGGMAALSGALLRRAFSK